MESLLKTTDLGKSAIGQQFLNLFLSHYDRVKFIPKDSCPIPPAPDVLKTLLDNICSVKLLTLQFACLENIFDKYTCHYKLVLPLNKSGNIECSINCVSKSYDTSLECLPCEDLILFGFLSSQNETPLSDRGLIFNTLHLQDSTSQIPCHLSISGCNELHSLVDKWILVTNVNVIYTSKKSGYLELVGEPILLTRSAILPKQTFDVLLVDDALLLLYNRGKFNVSNISVTGTVFAVSEIGKIKKDLVFFIELVKGNKSIVILVKNLHLHWQQLVCVGESYVFTSLKPTNIVTAMNSLTPLYVPTKTSQLHITNDYQLSVCLLKEILHENLQSEKSVKLMKPTCSRHSDAISYEGEITGCTADGVIILEDSIRLYLLYNLAFVIYKPFRVGTVLQVSNVHRKYFGKENQVRLYCCARSCIKVLKFTQMTSSILPLRTCFITVRAILKFNLSPTEIDTIQSMEAQFNTISLSLFKKSSEQRELAWERILSHVLKARKCVKSRQFVQEFIEYEHCCPASAKEDVSCVQTIHVRTFVPLDLRKEFEALAQGILADFETEKNKFSSSLLSSWRFRRRKFTDKVLVGYLSLNPDTGHLCFTDQFHSINAVCQFWTFNQTSYHHRCSGNCVIKRNDETFNFSCPYLHTWCLGKLIALDCFQLVLEVFINNSTGINKTETTLSLLDSSKFRLVKYLQFSLQDAVIMEDISRPSFQYWRKISNKTNQLQATFSDCDLCTCQVYLMTYKESLMENLFHKRKVSSLQFMTHGYFLGKPFTLPVRCIFEAATKFLHTKDSKSTQVKESSLDDKISESLLDAIHYEQTVISFQDNASKWYNTMQTEGSCYLLISYGNTSLSTPSTVFQSVYPLVLNKNVHKCYVCLSKNILVQEIPLAHLNSYYEAKLNWLPELLKKPSLKYDTIVKPPCLYTVSDLLCCSVTDTIVNLLPVIILTYVELNADDKLSMNSSEDATENSECDQKEFNAKLDFSSFVNKKFRMTVKDTVTNSDVNIYLNFKNVPYCVGLLPGTVVEFRHLQRKVSKKGNVYCQFVAVSTVRVLAGGISGGPDPTSGCSFNEMALMKGNQTTPTQDYCTFFALLKNHKRSLPFWNLVFVAQVLNLSIKTTCTECGSISCKNLCTNMSCKNIAYQLTVRSKLLLDDGSCMAYGFVWHSELLQKILGLSSGEWNDLIHAVYTSNGDICLETKNYNENQMLFQSNHNSSCLEQFLRSLCFSPVVKKEWWMVLVKKNIDCKDTIQERRIGFLDKIINTQCMPYQYMNIESVCTEPTFDIGAKMLSEISPTTVK
ncbi:CST complex subunit CTC1-like [Octopus sinensis]|uniref:CST complex subunit CTC1 n=1 Tax=Octopus sinensis TaxID=2607531 RepID=A0A7E6F8Y0_9MOLL|nr:CST complex subunit CTC1-like [Octopus sinensis]